MATLLKKKNKKGSVSHQIQYYHNGKRKTMTLGSIYTHNDAVVIKDVVERLLIALITGNPIDRRTSATYDSFNPELKQKFESLSLTAKEERLTCVELWDKYFDSEFCLLKERTQSNKKLSRAIFFKFFDEEARVDDITKKDVANFSKFLDKYGSSASKAGYIKDIRRVFNWGIENELVTDNLFNCVSRGSFINKERETYVSLDKYEAMLNVCEDSEERALLALYRIGGLRRNEALLLEWKHIDWDKGRVFVPSPKTAKYRENRLIPLFPALRKELDCLFKDGNARTSRYVIERIRGNTRNVLERLILLSGIDKWDRLIQNLRSSRAIDIRKEFGSLCESEWLGHSESVARDHYLHVCEDEFNKAAGIAVLKDDTAKNTAITRLNSYGSHTELVW